MCEIYLEGIWYVTQTAFLRFYDLERKEKFADVNDKGYHEGLLLLLTLKDDKILFRVKNALKMCTICYVRFSLKKEKNLKPKYTTHLWNFTIIFSVK